MEKFLLLILFSIIQHALVTFCASHFGKEVSLSHSLVAVDFFYLFLLLVGACDVIYLGLTFILFLPHASISSECQPPSTHPMLLLTAIDQPALSNSTAMLNKPLFFCLFLGPHFFEPYHTGFAQTCHWQGLIYLSNPHLQ